MPTGYTSFIESGEITTGKEFLKLCLHEFGVAYDQRDEPLTTFTIPTLFEPNPYFKKEYLKSVSELKKEMQLNKDIAYKRMKSEYEEKVECAKRNVLKYKDLKSKYKKVLDEVLMWNPPTMEHAVIKKFAIEQINMSTKYFDEHIKAYDDILNSKFSSTEEEILEYINRCINLAKSNVEYCKKLLDKEIEKAKRNTEFIERFNSSLELL